MNIGRLSTADMLGRPRTLDIQVEYETGKAIVEKRFAGPVPEALEAFLEWGREMGFMSKIPLTGGS